MKVKIKMFRGKLPPYLTVGKVYYVIKSNGSYAEIIGDDGRDVFICTDECLHLNDGCWEIVK